MSWQKRKLYLNSSLVEFLLTNQKVSAGADFRIEPTCIIITFDLTLQKFRLFQQEKMENKILIVPTKAFWQPRKSQDLSCNACIPYSAIDKINGELTCRICGYQTYREKSMKKHIEVSN